DCNARCLVTFSRSLPVDAVVGGLWSCLLVVAFLLAHLVFHLESWTLLRPTLPAIIQPSRGNVGNAQPWCCTQKSALFGARARTVVHAVHSMNSKRPGEGAWPT